MLGPLTFERPMLLLLAVLALPLGAIGWYAFASMSRLRRSTAIALRTVLLTLLALTLAGAASVRQTSSLATIVILDRSGSLSRYADLGRNELGETVSLDGAAAEFLARAQESRRADDMLGVIAVGASPRVAAAPSRLDVASRVLPEVEGSATDLAGAIRLAAGLIPPDAAGRIVVVSDGLATTGDPRRAVEALVAGDRGEPITVDVVPIDFAVEREVIVERVDAPPRAASGSVVPVRVQLRAAAPATGTLRLLREGREVDANGPLPGRGRRITLEAGTRVELIEVDLGNERLHRFEAVFEPDLDDAGEAVADRSLENNRATAFTLTPAAGSVLVLDGVSAAEPTGAGMTLPNALRDVGLEVEVAVPAAMPRSLVAMQSHDLVILQNVPADALDETQQALLEDYARDLGGGVLFTGGPQAFGAGGWKGSAIEDIFPLRLDLPDRLVIPEAAIVIVLDRSGSMADSVLGSARSQQEIAGEAAARAVESLEATDLVGVISFSSTPTTEVKLGPNSNPERTTSRIRGITSNGGTALAPAMRSAQSQLKDAEAKTKHVIILTDGRSQNAEILPMIAEAMRDDGIRVSTIGVGDASDNDTLERVAQRGGGTFYSVVNPNVLPRVFLRAVRVVRSPLVREQPFQPRVLPTASPLTAGVESTPGLDGLTLTRFRDDPGIITAMAHPEGEPLLAHWTVGLGQVAAFTSDAHEWAELWLDWPGYRGFWAQVARSLSRPDERPIGELTASLDGSGARASIRLAAEDEAGTPLDLLSVPATVYAPDGTTRDVRLLQTGPGLYSADLGVDLPGTHVIVAKPALAGDALPPVITAVNVPAGAEYRRLRSDRAALESLAAATGGDVYELSDLLGENAPDLFARTGIRPREARTPLWPLLLGWSVVVFLLDVGTRRIAWDRLIDPEWRREIAASTARADSISATRIRSKRDQPVSDRAPVAAATAALSDKDARRVASEQASKRYEAQRERLAAIRAKRDEVEKGDSADSAADEPSSGLLAAKRRARERFEELE